MEFDCDILIPAALEQQLNKNNCERVRTRRGCVMCPAPTADPSRAANTAGQPPGAMVGVPCRPNPLRRPQIKAKIIGEAANGPVTPAADKHFNERGILVVPDMCDSAAMGRCSYTLCNPKLAHCTRAGTDANTHAHSPRYLNAGGVVVSYFEWLKNLSNVRFGRLNRRFDERRGKAIINVLKRSGLELTESESKAIVRGASEEDLAHSGLEDTMINSLGQVRMAAAAAD